MVVVFHFAVLAINVGVVLVINVLFIILTNNATNSQATALKTGLAVFKIAWGVFLGVLDKLLLPGLNQFTLTVVHKKVKYKT